MRPGSRRANMPEELYRLYESQGWHYRDICTAFEVVPFALYSTKILTRGQEAPLRFFDEVSKPEQWTNMYLACQLPNPQAMMVERVQIFGISSVNALYTFWWCIGNKEYARRPAWLCTIRPGFECWPPIIIPPAYNFRAELRWQGPAEMGKGFEGKEIQQRPVQVAFIGQLARPIQ